MDRSILHDQSDIRSYDHLWNARSALFAIGQAALDLMGSASTVIAGFAATPTGPASLSINLAAGDVYQQAAVDATAFGDLTSDATQTLQQGFAAAQVLTLSTSGLSSGQSRWALVQATFTQTDAIPSDDPTGGLLPYLNTDNPSGPPWSGPANDGETQPTRRKSVATVSVVYGTVASTGTEVPPTPSSGNVPLYLVDLAFGQTTITTGEILVAGPSVGANVPNNYPQAPFLAGLLKSHHGGTAGQAPKIDLTKEVQGVLPGANMDPSPIQGQAGNFAAATGSANAYVAAYTPAIAAHTKGLPLRFTVPTSTVVGTATFNPGPGALTLRRGAANADFYASDLVPNVVYTAIYNGTDYDLVDLISAGISGTGNLPAVVIPDDGSFHTICSLTDFTSGGIALIRITAGGPSSKTWAGLILAQQFASGTGAGNTPAFGVTVQNTPGTVAFQVSGQNVQMSITGGAGNYTITPKVVSL